MARLAAPVSRLAALAFSRAPLTALTLARTLPAPSSARAPAGARARKVTVALPLADCALKSCTEPPLPLTAMAAVPSVPRAWMSPASA